MVHILLQKPDPSLTFAIWNFVESRVTSGRDVTWRASTTSNRDVDLSICAHAYIRWGVLCCRTTLNGGAYNYHSPYTGLILRLCPAIERWRYFVTMSLFGWLQPTINPDTSVSIIIFCLIHRAFVRLIKTRNSSANISEHAQGTLYTIIRYAV